MRSPISPGSIREVHSESHHRSMKAQTRILKLRSSARYVLSSLLRSNRWSLAVTPVLVEAKRRVDRPSSVRSHLELNLNIQRSPAPGGSTQAGAGRRPRTRSPTATSSRTLEERSCCRVCRSLTLHDAVTSPRLSVPPERPCIKVVASRASSPRVVNAWMRSRPCSVQISVPCGDGFLQFVLARAGLAAANGDSFNF